MSLLGSPAPATSVADVAMADAEMRHFIRVIDGQDLYERIKQMRGRDGYLGPSSFPPQIHAIPGASSPLPAVVLERSEAASRCGGTCFCGLLTDIGHAWASVESSLFLWKYDSHSAVPVEYAAELRSITAVGTVIPREGALSEAISKLLVVCTTHEVALLGAHFSDRHATLGLNPLPLFSAATDEPICAVASTASGRIFVGGLRGNIYEVEYGVAGWRGRRCALVCVTPGLQRWIPPLVRDIVHAALPLWGRQEDAIEQLVVDDTSSTLVARTRMGLSVFHVHSMHRARRVGHIPDLIKRCLAERSLAKELKKDAPERLVAVAPITSAETERLGVVAVTDKGHRIVLSTTRRAGAPTALEVRAVLPPLTQTAPDPTSSAVTAAGYHAGVFVSCHTAPGASSGSDSGRAPRTAVLASLQRQAAAPGASGLQINGIPGASTVQMPPGVVLAPGVTALSPASKAPVEHVAVMDRDGLPGSALVVAPVPWDAEFSEALCKMRKSITAVFLGDLVGQFVLPRSHFVLMTDCVVAQLERRWPVDLLEDLLMAQRAPLGGMSSLSDFTREWGAAETASMCFLLLSRASTHAPVRRAALELLSSPALTRADPVAPSERNTSAGHAPIVPYERPRALTASKWYPPSSVVLPSSQGMVAQGSLAPPPLRRWGIGGINTIAAMFQGSSSTHGRKDVAQEARHGGQPSILQWHPPMVWPIPGAVRAYDGTGEVLSTALSAANQGLWLALSRMLLPYWDSTFFIKRKSMPGKGVQKAGALAFRPPLPVDHLQATRDALVMLHGALKDREGKQTHKSQVGWGSTSARVRGEDDRPADRGLLFTPEDRPARAKKLRLEEPGVAPRKGAPHALHAEVEAVGSDEERLMASAKALIGRASEVLSLMLLCKQHGAMQHLRSLDKTAGDALPGLTLRAAVTEDAGEKVVRALLHLLRPDEAGDALHGQLLTWCPSFFKVEDRKALEAARHLSEAEALPEGPERTDRAQQAVRVLLELPASADLGSAVPKLIRLGMLDGAIQVVLKAAHAVDGEQQAAQSGLEGESARFRRHHVYQHLMAAAVSAHPSAVSGLLQSQAALQDPWLLDYMYEYLVQADMTELLLADAPFSRLEDFLLRAAAMDPDLTRPVPSMDRAQAKCLGVLADLYVQQGCLDKTASVLEALARRDGAQLQERRSLLTRAIAAGESASISTLDVRLLLKIVDLQAEVLDRIDKTGPASLTAEARLMLETTLLDLSALYNDYAQPLCMWDICLRALDTSDTASAHPDIVRSLWENLLVGEDGSAVSLDDARQRLVELGPLLSPHKGTLPLSYIVQHVFGIAGERLQLQSCVSAVAEDVIRCTTSSSMVHALGAFGEIMQSSHEPTYIQAAAVAVAHLAKLITIAGAESADKAALRAKCQELRLLMSSAPVQAAESISACLSSAIAILDRRLE